MDANPKVIAFYLPQYHPIPENDEWWGKGFTDWLNVARATPLFRGHVQPQQPADLGFYDLRARETREAQADLAREHGIHGFCYYYYWFEGRTVLDRPLQEVLATGEPDFPFCICWANENWTRRWDGREDEVLLQQRHTPESDAAFLRDVLPILADPRYIRVDGKPVLLVYRVGLMPDPARTARDWRRIAEESGLPGLHLCAVQAFERVDPRPIGFDAAVEFPPHCLTGLTDHQREVEGMAADFQGHVWSYAEVAQQSLAREPADYRLHRGLMVGWDNTPRRGNRAWVYQGSSPELYGSWLRSLLEQAWESGRPDELVFVNAWNEWAEGAHLEPDLVHEQAFLRATQEAGLVAPRRLRGRSNERRAWPLATSRRRPVLAWPAWDDPDSLRGVLRLVADAGAVDDPEFCLCLRVDPEVDPPSSDVIQTLQATSEGLFDADANLEVLLVDDPLSEEDWPWLGAALLASISLMDGQGDDRRARFFQALERPIVADAEALRDLPGLRPAGAPALISAAEQPGRRPGANAEANASPPAVSGESPLEAQPRVVCILGMHRSGTSAVTRLLNMLGLYLGPDDHLIPPLEDNPEGFWEHARFVEINDEILRRLGGSVHELPLLLAGWQDLDELDDLKTSAREFVQEEFAGKPLWGWKDPRTCLTLPFWQEVIGPMEYVLCIRNPLDIAASLRTRNKMSIHQAMEQWLEHTCSALLYMAKNPGLIFSYDGYFTDSAAEIERLAGFLSVPSPLPGSSHWAELTEFIQDGLHHHRSTVDDLVRDASLTPGEKALYLALASRVGSEHPQGTLDQATVYECYRQASRERHHLLSSAFAAQIQNAQRAISRLERDVAGDGPGVGANLGLLTPLGRSSI